ncbi:energy coupling factor transporter S component ThiW [Lentilactobacillus hilgardii]|uniref:Protein ThiW n=1 Tax=Lentilactobacillus hilgardii (strain ATCC 8290 / DSM 20176 / CCUG 30140 / JCM 1155 / KCTC 3500 / NBRC 15886 / NCIMB 8040 / NRRL B-1843 / 9) TaxID=1423757 RepID=C0XJ37_LENH9|nr:energy coupling factor transporter S component ThiW [Lentilactobacillus hilgardii]EEI24616.1 protein ThiW [Lentilactobacillus hilgardii DSM 20176 = ATCC 8290]MCP9332954.1 energy coupling factor transporter S component ThiW [Lentilactobacillus hilgardii]MCP9349587.1 energy coupling factor transporter S component ThiW [Lentilactobacillus hilgardii]MCP9352455.1 energy coupling factor transporter S component ThiW [Lentilactobacillus hilgardii]QEU37627.1 energy coupling factor transporter S comp
MNRSATYKMILTALLSALGVVGGSMFEFTIGVAKVAPMQHLINLISGVLVGPWWAITQAFITSLIRNILGTGTVLAFPGSMIGAFCVGWLFQKTRNLFVAACGELVGTGIIGAIVAYPVAKWLMGVNGALWLFVPSFFLSALVGVMIGYVILLSMWKQIISPQLKKLDKK